MGLALAVGLTASAATPSASSVGVQVPHKDLNAVQTSQVRTVFQPVTTGKKHVKRNVPAVAEDFVGTYKWSGDNMLSGVSAPNSGIMTISLDADHPGTLIVDGLPYESSNNMNLLTNCYVKDGKLYIPNQFMYVNTFYNQEVWFYNYCVKNRYVSAEESSTGKAYWEYQLAINHDSEFYFQFDAKGNLIAGEPVDAEKWNNHEYTDEWLKENVCIGALVMPNNLSGYFWLCSFIETNKKFNEFVFNAEEWNYVGMATFKDAWLPGFWVNGDTPVYEVPAYRNLSDPNRYLLYDPYGRNTPYGENGINVSDKTGYIVFNVLDPDYIMVEPLVYGLSIELEEGVADPMYVFNLEGYYSYIDDMTIQDISDVLQDEGKELSYFDPYTLSVQIYNPYFSLKSPGLTALRWSDESLPAEGYIILPKGSTDPVEPEPSGVTMYVIGADVDGESWNLGTNRMTETSSGVYEWSGTKLGNEFKINDGTWDASYNIGAGEDGFINLDTPYHYYMGDGSGNIAFDGFSLVNNPKIVLDMNAGTIVLSGEPGEIPPVEPGDVTFYMIGSNVNGQTWALAQEDAAFTYEGNGIYRWKGEVLGSGFKINDGTWSNSEYNIGGAGNDIVMNQPFYYWANGNSGNIGFDGFTTLINPEVVLDTNEETITLVGGTPEGVSSWYIAGINGEWNLDNNWILNRIGDSKIFEREIYIVETTGVCKISDDGWSHQYGTNFPEFQFIDLNNMTSYLEPVSGEGGNVPYELPEGTYTVRFDLDDLTLSFISLDNPQPIPGSFYLIGSNVNGYNWSLSEPNAKFTSLGDGNYIWEGTVLGKEFKINDGTWTNPEYNIGAPEGQADITIGEPFVYATDIDSRNITLSNCDLILYPVVYLNTNDGTITILSGEPYTEGTENADYPETLYIISDNVNGGSESYELTMAGNGIFTWEGSSLGSFRIKDGEDTPLYTIGSAGAPLLLGMPYDYVAGLSVADFTVEGYEELANVSLVLNLNTWQITLSSGYSSVDSVETEKEAEAVYYDLHGIRINNPEPGNVYIKVTAGKAEKVMM